ncbi:MAG: HAMP domain-containing protein [Chloroflexia bacterium]|nr:HAMP domain-containing protein [Chloroflexia bacterium]
MATEQAQVKPERDSLPAAKLPSPQRKPHLGRLGRAIIWRFGLYAFFSLLIIVALSSYVVWAQIQNVRTTQEQTAIWAAQLLDQWTQEINNHLIAAALSIEPETTSGEELELQLHDLFNRSSTFLRLTLVDARPENYGQEILSVSQTSSTSSGRYLGDEWWFILTLSEGSHISEVKFGNLGAPSVTMARVIEQDKESVAVLAAEVDLSWANSNLLRQFRSEERGSYIYVVNKEGLPFLHQHAPFVMSRETRLDIPGIRSATQNEPLELYYIGLNDDSLQVIGAYQPTKRGDWFVIAEQPRPWVLQRLVPAIAATAAALCLSILVPAAVAFYVSRRVARPIVQLQKSAQRIGAGDLQHRIHLHGHNELADLAHEFNRAAENLQESQLQLEQWSHELEDRVEERTGELRQAFEQLQQQAQLRENLLRTIRQMSSPVIPIMKGIIVMPIVGSLDSERAQRVTEDLLSGIERERAQVTILDVTGLAIIDTAVANAILQATAAAELLGAQAILVGIAPEVAETLVHLGLDLGNLRTAATLQQGLRLGLKLMRQRMAQKLSAAQLSTQENTPDLGRQEKPGN